jgi:quercetin dioxygenase-like cupin family protein
MKAISLADLPVEGVSHDPDIAKQVMLRRGDVPHLTNFSRASLLPGQVARAHRHRDMFEVFFVESGAGTITIDGAERGLEAGVCIAIEPGEEHEIRNSGSTPLALLYFGIES